MKHFLSKSQFLRGIQCHKSLWLYKNNPELRTLPDDSKQAIFEMGVNVGVLARELFPGGTEIKFQENSIEQKIRKTQDLISSGVKTIYEAAFLYRDIIVFVDILHKDDKGWGIYEVKASTDSNKDVYRNDVALQYYVVTESGLPLASASLVILNKDYVRYGDIDVQKLFIIEDLTEVSLQSRDFVISKLDEINIMLKGPCPDIDIGNHCSDPYECDFSEYCWKHIPEYSIFNISRLKSDKKFDLYRNGIINFKDIPADYPLSDNQRLQVEAEINDIKTINKSKLTKFLDKLSFPRHYLDFETYMPAIPIYDGTKPFQQIVFQFSLHVQEDKDSKLIHYEYLMQEGTNKREELVERLTSLIPENACVIVYNAGFEKTRIKEMAEQFPDYSKKLLKINDNIIDLMEPFKNKHFYIKEFKGSYSIKCVLPAIVPELSYKGMFISDGGEAMRAYEALPFVKEKEKAEQIKKDLLEYCKLDTLGMVKIVEKLQEI